MQYVVINKNDVTNLIRGGSISSFEHLSPRSKESNNVKSLTIMITSKETERDALSKLWTIYFRDFNFDALTM
ncbi:uncharacterized protein DS421_15g521460 [Arachis hypogaea]|nr:uncharacterized protein DS421_15g521460 [Arachis hypogaea]